jgi:hypothetical protein
MLFFSQAALTGFPLVVASFRRGSFGGRRGSFQSPVTTNSPNGSSSASYLLQFLPVGGSG